MEAALSALCDRLWAELVAAPADRTSPYRLAALATVRERVPQVRTIVVRDVVASEREVVCFSDRRAPKIADIAHCAEVSLLVRDDTRSEQIRLNGVASVHPSGPRADAYWRDMHPGQTLNYLTTA
ncbi:MAG: pyridoxamine 5'-phosphate oxidase family protein, partial [Gammaproteobacteria bacterium]|nr:pyridoxamine 5'-phosphate oxidase family protein [Gammaproteobacteria bacterium]